MALYQRAQREASTIESWWYPGPNGALCQHPALKTVKEMRPIIDKLRRQWGLTPHDLAMLGEQESKANIPKPDAEDEAFDEL